MDPGEFTMIRPALITSLNFCDDLVVARENHRRMSQPAGMIHVHAYLERLIDGFRAVDREHRKQFLDRQRMFAAHALNRRNQQLGVGLDAKDRPCARYRWPSARLPCGCMQPGLRIDDRAPQHLRLFLAADVRAQVRKLLQDAVIDLVIDHHRLL